MSDIQTTEMFPACNACLRPNYLEGQSERVVSLGNKKMAWDAAESARDTEGEAINEPSPAERGAMLGASIDASRYYAAASNCARKIGKGTCSVLAYDSSTHSIVVR